MALDFLKFWNWGKKASVAEMLVVMEKDFAEEGARLRAEATALSAAGGSITRTAKLHAQAEVYEKISMRLKEHI